MPAFPVRSISAVRWIGALLLACAAGCANFTPEQCRAANWYSLGEQDALFYGLQPQIHHLAHACRKAGVEIAERDYMEGWFVGDRERAVRLLGGACCAP